MWLLGGTLVYIAKKTPIKKLEYIFDRVSNDRKGFVDLRPMPLHF